MASARTSAPTAVALIATVHPSALLRAERESREAEIAAFMADLRKVLPLLS